MTKKVKKWARTNNTIVYSLLATFEDMGNPFLEDSGNMLTLDTKVVMNKDEIQTVNAVE